MGTLQLLGIEKYGFDCSGLQLCWYSGSNTNLVLSAHILYCSHCQCHFSMIVGRGMHSIDCCPFVSFSLSVNLTEEFYLSVCTDSLVYIC